MIIRYLSYERYMILQQWINSENNEIMVVERYSDKGISSTGCVFLPGLGQNKAGLYFLYTSIAEKICSEIPTLQVDYAGFGDSKGNLHDCTKQSIRDDIDHAVNYFIKKYNLNKIILVSSGFANLMALETALDKRAFDYELVLIKPFLEGALVDKYESSIDLNYVDSNELLDTAYIIDWDKNEDLFQWLGAGRNRTKGLLINKEFFMELIKSSVKDKILLCEKKMFIVTSNGNMALENEFGNKIEWFFSKKEDPNILNMVERKTVINKIVDWIQNHCS